MTYNPSLEVIKLVKDEEGDRKFEQLTRLGAILHGKPKREAKGDKRQAA